MIKALFRLPSHPGKNGLIHALLVTGLMMVSVPLQAAVILMYHHFGEARYPSTNVTLEQFDAQLALLETEGYRIWPLQRIVDHIEQQKPLPDKVVAITVDDAYLSVYTRAFPRMKQRNWPLTVFVSTDNVDNKLPAFMSWAQMREMQKHGIQFANHSSSHDSLAAPRKDESFRRWRKRVRQDILHAQLRLEQELGQAPMLFAYPYGEYSQRLAGLVDRLGFTAFGQQSGAVSVHNDIRALPRFPIAEAFADISEFAIKVASLAMPVHRIRPWDPVTDEQQPELTVTLKDSDLQNNQLKCYVSGQGEVRVNWLSDTSFSVRAAQALPAGRSRYNCTAPSSQSGRYYWFSHPWIRPSVSTLPF